MTTRFPRSIRPVKTEVLHFAVRVTDGDIGMTLVAGKTLGCPWTAPPETIWMSFYSKVGTSTVVTTGHRYSALFYLSSLLSSTARQQRLSSRTLNTWLI